MINLYPYQAKAVYQLREAIKGGANRVGLFAPTGAGKTVMFSYLTSRIIANGKRVLILTHRSELLTQAGGTLTKFGLSPIHIKPSYRPKTLRGNLYVAMTQTLVRRFKKPLYDQWLANDVDVVIVDECHRCDFNTILSSLPDHVIVIGVTATPHREKNQPALSDFYQDMVEVAQVQELIALGKLAKPISYGVSIDLTGVKSKGNDYDTNEVGKRMDEVQLYHGVYENYMKYTPNQKAIVFSSSIESSKTLVDSLCKKGLPAKHLDGSTNAKERREILKWFASTPNAILSNMGILTAGFDEPTIEVVILYRATKSLPLFLQMVGRGSRTHRGKDSFTILDFGNNIATHGFWEQDRVWSLEKPKRKRNGLGVAPIKECPSCSAYLAAQAKECEYCGHVFPPTKEQEQKRVVAELKRLTYSEIQKAAAGASFEELEQLAAAKGYSKNWIFYQLKTKEQLQDYAKFKNYSHKWVNYQLKLRRGKKF